MKEFEKTFDHAVLDYDASRPTYTKELYDDIFTYHSIDGKSKVLEIGIGTGKATKPFLDTGAEVIAIEPGGNLAAFAKERFAKYRNITLLNITLQEYECLGDSFDLVYAATAFHWIPEDYGYKKVYELLKKGGCFARFAYHAGMDKTRPELVDEIQNLYKTYAGWNKAPKEFGEEDAKKIAFIAEKYGFIDIEYKLYHWTKDFTADEYMQLLRTYPDHMAIEPKEREKLFLGIAKAIEKHGGIITIHYTADMQLGRKG
jgi:SAM-dependent methyltransferase